MLSEINMKAVASHHHERMRWVVVAICWISATDPQGGVRLSCFLQRGLSVEGGQRSTR